MTRRGICQKGVFSPIFRSFFIDSRLLSMGCGLTKKAVVTAAQRSDLCESRGLPKTVI
jgi:hypothetical protein